MISERQKKCVAAFAGSAESASDGVKYLKSAKTAVVIKIKNGVLIVNVVGSGV